MKRAEIVQQALDRRGKGTYLEIGVDYGRVFRRITADEKIAVDPEFKVSRRTRRRAEAKAHATHYFEKTSDAFFAEETGFLTDRGIDVALVDGLHTYGQAVRDVENTLRYLGDDGVIVLHDCNPAKASVASVATSYADFRARNRWKIAWSGDVWKAIVHLRTRADLRVAVLDCDYGVGIVRKGCPESRLSYSAAQIDDLDYEDLAADRRRLLNLRPTDDLSQILA